MSLLCVNCGEPIRQAKGRELVSCIGIPQSEWYKHENGFWCCNNFNYAEAPVNTPWVGAESPSDYIEKPHVSDPNQTPVVVKKRLPRKRKSVVKFIELPPVIGRKFRGAKALDN